MVSSRRHEGGERSSPPKSLYLIPGSRWGRGPCYERRSMSRKRIGELLLDRGAISRAQLDAGLQTQQRTRQRLGVTLIQMGAISEVQLAQVLAQSLGLATVDLAAVQVDGRAVHLLRARFCETHELFPFAIDKTAPGKRVMVALSDPLNQPAVEEIEFTTGLAVAAYVSTHSQIRAAILRYYHKVAPETVERAGPLVSRRPAADETATVVGQELASPAAQPALLPPKSPRSQTAKDLDFLFGKDGHTEATETLEHRFWTLMRLLERKGLVSRDEFLRSWATPTSSAS